jgi:hypothetical protein
MNSQSQILLNMKSELYKIYFYSVLLLCFINRVNAQGDEPWFGSSGAVWNSNSNMTHIYGTSTTWTAFTVTSEASIGNPGALCASPTNDQWLRIPHNGCDNIRITVNWENTNTAASRRARFAIYRGSNCTSGSCNLTLLTSQCFNTGTSSDCFGNTLVIRRQDVSFSAGEFIFVRLWDQDNSSSSRASVFAVCGASNTPSVPNNEDCATPTYITNNGACAGTNWNAPSGGFAALGSANCSWGVNENPVFYEFTATATTMTLNVNGVRCYGSGCQGLGSQLQFAVFPKSSPCTSIPASARLNAVGNPAEDCYIGVGTVGGAFDGLVVGQRYLIILDGLNGARCSWTGISINNAAPLPTVSVNDANICASSSATLTVNGLTAGQTVTWTADPADATLSGQTNNSSITVSPSVTTTYTATLNLGSNGRLCDGRMANALPITATVNVLNTGGLRIAPTGPQCSGTQLNFTSSPTGGNGVYSYSWSTTNPAAFTGSGQNFSPTPVNNSCGDQVVTVTLNVTSAGRTCPRTFTPTIRPIPQLTGNQIVDCATATLDLADAAINACSCVGCTYTLTGCSDCTASADPIGTSNSSGQFFLSGATSATFTTSLNGCTGSTQTINFLDAPYNCTLLPVELLSFKGTCEKKSVELLWSTGSETGNDYFLVERSLDGSEFSAIGMIDGNGDSESINQYLFNDNFNGLKQKGGTLYYRLRQVDFDGTASFTKVIAVECSADLMAVNIYPNPAGNQLFVEVPTSSGQLRIYNISGQKLSSKTLNSLVNEVDLSELIEGTYFIQLIGDSFSHTEKLVIIK